MTVPLTRRRVLRGIGAGAGLALVGPTLRPRIGPTFWRQPGFAADAPAGLHLTFGDDPRSQMNVTWSTPASVSKPKLRIGTDATFGRTIEAETRSLINGPQLYHHAAIDDLDPATTYHYRVEHDGAVSDALTFTTAPDRPQPFRFTAFGDQGVKDYSVAPIVERVEALKPAFHFHVGDLSYASGTGGVRALELSLPVSESRLYQLGTWDAWLDGISPVARTVPWMPAIGNHEMEVDGTELGYDGWKTRFSIPTTGVPFEISTTYWFRYGNAAFLALDANDASYELPRNHDFLGGAQEIWLRGMLSKLRADPTIDWIVVGFHHCGYCSDYRHGSDGAIRDRWEPLFDEFEVDLVINGHNHVYERTHPIVAGQPTVELPVGGETTGSGTVWVTSGLGDETDIPPDFTTAPMSGVTLYTGQDLGLRVPEPTPWSALRQDFAAMIVVADVEPPGPAGVTRLSVGAVDAAGTEVDRFTLVRTSQAGPGPGSADGSPPTQEPLPATGGGVAAAALAIAGAAALRGGRERLV